MQRAQDSSTELVPRPDSPRTALSPTLTFLLLVLVIALIGAAVFLTRPKTEVRAAATTPESTTPNFALTNEEAIARFHELHRIYRRASINRDVSSIELLLTQGSPNRVRAVKDIRQLIKDGVLDKSRFETLAVDVTSRSNTSISISQKVVVYPSFLDEETGEQLARARPTRDEVSWVLRLEGDDWLVHRIQLVRSEPLKS